MSSAAARIPRPALARTTPLWGFLAALGGALVAGSIALTLSAIARESLDTLWTDAPFLPFFLPFQVSEFTGGLAAAAIARAAGGRRALLLFLGYELCNLLIGFARAQLAQTELFGPFDPLAFVERQIPLTIGVALGALVLRRAVGQRPGTNALLEGAGAFALTSWLASLAASLLIRTPPPAGNEPWSILLLFAVIAAIPAALVFIRRAEQPLCPALVLAAVLVLTWIYPLGLSQISMSRAAGQPFVLLLLIAAPAVAAALCLAITAAGVRLTREAARDR